MSKYEIQKERFDDLLSKVSVYVNKINEDKRICFIMLDYNEIHDTIDCNIFWDRMTYIRSYPSQRVGSNDRIVNQIKLLIPLRVDLYIHFSDC